MTNSKKPPSQHKKPKKPSKKHPWRKGLRETGAYKSFNMKEGR